MNLSGTKHIVWDWNGTLLDDAVACVEAMNGMLAVRNLGHLALDRYRNIFGFPVRNYYRTLGFDLEHEDWDALAREFHNHYARTSRGAPLRAGMAAVLEALKRRALPMSILSASESSILKRMLAERGVIAYFQSVHGLDNLHAASKLDLGRELMRAIGLPPEDVLLIGDTTHDHEVAHELKCRCLLVAGGHQSASRLAACRCGLVNGPEDILTALDGATVRKGAA
jgi:phosphoglycolate phosphatase